jgi:hypothetical protein
MIMSGVNRAPATLLGAAVAGVLEPFGRTPAGDTRRVERMDERAADEPTAAERREVATDGRRRRTPVR